MLFNIRLFVYAVVIKVSSLHEFYDASRWYNLIIKINKLRNIFYEICPLKMFRKMINFEIILIKNKPLLHKNN